MCLAMFLKEETAFLEYKAKDQKICLWIFVKEKSMLTL